MRTGYKPIPRDLSVNFFYIIRIRKIMVTIKPYFSQWSNGNGFALFSRQNLYENQIFLFVKNRFFKGLINNFGV